MKTYGKIGSHKTRIEITSKYGLKLLWLAKGEGVVIRFGPRNVAFFSSYFVDSVDDIGKEELYRELIEQAGNGSCNIEKDNLQVYRRYITNCIHHNRTLDYDDFQKEVDKKELAEALQ